VSVDKNAISPDKTKVPDKTKSAVDNLKESETVIILSSDKDIESDVFLMVFESSLTTDLFELLSDSTNLSIPAFMLSTVIARDIFLFTSFVSTVLFASSAVHVFVLAGNFISSLDMTVLSKEGTVVSDKLTVVSSIVSFLSRKMVLLIRMDRREILQHEHRV
jgi:hypothetical protein